MSAIELLLRDPHRRAETCAGLRFAKSVPAVVATIRATANGDGFKKESVIDEAKKIKKQIEAGGTVELK